MKPTGRDAKPPGPAGARDIGPAGASGASARLGFGEFQEQRHIVLRRSAVAYSANAPLGGLRRFDLAAGPIAGASGAKASIKIEPP